MGFRVAAVLLGMLARPAFAAPPVMSNRNPPAPRPSARTGPASTLDRAAPETFWVFGGNATLAGTNNELWAYDVAANTWAQRTVSGATPSNRAWAALSWDVAQQRLVLFGGSTDLNGPLLADVRLFDPATNAWALPTVMGTPPSARFLARMVYVPHQGRHLLFGGGTATNANAEATTLTNELWALTVDAGTNSVTWQLLSPAGAPPPGRASPCVGYDPARRRLVVYGGELVNASIGDVWQYDVDANAWFADTPTGTSPGTRGAVLCTFDERTGKLQVYGGTNTPSGAPQGGAFTYEPVAQAWTQVMPSSTPGGRTSGGMAYSPGVGGLLFFGGRASLISVSQETWSMRVNAPPALTLPAPLMVDESALVSLAASATDADSADVLNWSWTQTAGPMVTLSSTSVPAPTFTTPRVTANTMLQFFVNVTDGVEPRDGGVTVVVRDSLNEPPVADAGNDVTVDPGQVVSLDGTASSDPNGEALTYQWAQQAGPAVTLGQANTALAQFTAPSVAGGTTVRFELTVTDVRLGTASDSVDVAVRPPPEPDAGSGADSGVGGGAGGGGGPDSGVGGGGGGGSGDDGGSTDGGPGDGGLADAGPGTPRRLGVGCGCTTGGGPGAVLLGWALWRLRVGRRSRRARPMPR